MTSTKASRVRTTILVLILGWAAGQVSCRKPEQAAPRRINFADVVAQKHREYLKSPINLDRDSIYLERSRSQDQLLEEFSQCPDCFARKYTGAQRTYLFDAVTDCQTTMRFGTRFDGGKWICDPQSIPASSVVYSFGVGDNISFDMDMAGMFGCDVYMFDPSPSVVDSFSHFPTGQACGKGHVSYQPIGLGPVSDAAGHQWDLIIEGKRCETRSLADIARSLHHTHVEILKIDIEGGEFASLQEMLTSQVLLALQVKQLVVEFHLWDDAAFMDFVRTVGALKKQGFLPFRKEFNPYAADKCAEYSFLRN